jgi:hypothetical protein
MNQRAPFVPVDQATEVLLMEWACAGIPADERRGRLRVLRAYRRHSAHAGRAALTAQDITINGAVDLMGCPECVVPVEDLPAWASRWTRIVQDLNDCGLRRRRHPYPLAPHVLPTLLRARLRARWAAVDLAASLP